MTRPVRKSDPKQFAAPPITKAPPPKADRPKLPAPPKVEKPTRPPRPFKFPSIPARPPQPPVLLGKHPKVPPPRKRSPPPPPSPPSPPSLPTSLRKNGKKTPRLFIKSSVTSGNRDFNYNVAVDRQDWKPLPANYHPANNY